MRDGLYHKEIFWLPEFDGLLEKYSDAKIEISKHTKENIRKQENRIYNLEDITMNFIQKGYIFEIEVKKGKIVKFVTRNKYTATDDICIVLQIKGKDLICKTCWLNRQDDTHYTLNEKRYVHGEVKEVHNSMEVSILDLIKSKRN